MKVEYTEASSPITIVHRDVETCHSLIVTDLYMPCGHKCTYCFTRQLPYIKHATQEEVYKVWINRPRLLKRFMERHRDLKYPIRIGALSDVGPPYDITIPLLNKILHYAVQYKYPLIIFTKVPLHRYDETASLIIRLADYDAIAVAVTVTHVDPKVYHLLEPRAPSAKQRLDFLEWLHRHQVPATLRVSPLIQGVTDEPEVFTTILNQVSKTHVVVEYLRLRTRHLVQQMKMKLKVSSWEWDRQWHYYLAPQKYRQEKYKQLKQLANREGWTYAVCGDPIKIRELPKYQDAPDCCSPPPGLYVKYKPYVPRLHHDLKIRQFLQQILPRTPLYTYDQRSIE